ncbi:dolichyl-P-Man:Man(5)GlcNAc(2)-PP-dolichol alpha-1,3-mannosyltransferase [Turnera subulata]|uniref:dolichyl-P-Man:Man5GlcNAc2-PP-dolichol alpha-1,3-mannosyltransferase n=1 Tax=Turnera subulata TaxID=218843 RepID=A0A9Q0JRX0_9ROSI|nr:dolichyl-P-Man:Man(5)GlcNAc(2)-PP-dolichol alpha-1,3-mannosyltransferase [Turnera subulata]
MALKTARKQKPSRKSQSWATKLFKNPKAAFALVLILADALLVALIISYVPYTKIDWDAYMSQVTGFLQGERDYSNLKGDTGPLVYPAGFLYVYSAIQYVTGGEVYPAQILFGILYIINLAIILFIYVKTDVLPWWALILLSLSKRVHSIFVLRLFNDCFAMALLHAAVASVLCQHWHLGLVLFSGAVSIKMNVLLYAPSLLLLMLKAMDIRGVISALVGAAIVQILLGLPFLLSYPIAYVSRAFNLGRVFIHFWYFLFESIVQTFSKIILCTSILLLSVNFKFVPEPVFVSKQFAVSLLITHLGLLAAFAHCKWCKHEGGLLNFLRAKVLSIKQTSLLSGSSASSSKTLKGEHIMTTMFAGNFIGILCARSLHYQFYSWYFYSLPYLLWRTPFPTILRLILFISVEFCWNVYPSNIYSSGLLLCLHSIILWGLWAAPPEYPYMENKSSSREKHK